MSEQLASQFWTRMQACLPSHYRTLDWENLPQSVRSAMSRVVAEFVQERDYKVINSARQQVIEQYIHWVASEQSAAQLGFRLKKMRIEPPEV